MKKRARLTIKDRLEFQDGAFAEVRLWEVPESKDKLHGYKYFLERKESVLSRKSTMMP